MNTMTCKGYTARIEFDDRDGILVGRVLGLRDTITFHGETVSKLRADFDAAIKHYLAVCKKAGISPEKPVSGKVLLRLPTEVHGAALVAAQAEGKSLNQWAIEVLRNATHA